MAYGLQTAIWENRRRTAFVVASIPLMVVAATYAAVVGPAYLSQAARTPAAAASPANVAEVDYVAKSLSAAHQLAGMALAASGLWALVSFLFQRQLIFAWSGARPVERREEPEAYNAVENLCISRGLPMPRVGVIEDDSMNAFATGWGKNSWIVFSRGLLRKLDRRELSAVAAHELAHVVAKDTLLMAAVAVYAGAVLAVGEILMRAGSGSSEKKDRPVQIVLVGVALYVLGILVLPLVRLALSRRREFQADAGSVDITHDKEAMISALRKISSDSCIESIQKAAVADMCFADPFLEPMALGAEGGTRRAKGFGSWVAGLLSTHPSVEDRIKAIQEY